VEIRVRLLNSFNWKSFFNLKNKNILTIGISGFPYLKAAPVIKCLYINKAFAEAGFNTLVLNTEPLINGLPRQEYILSGNYEGVNYQSLTGFFRTGSKIKRKAVRVFSGLFEFFFLIRYNFKLKVDVVLFFTNGSFFKLVYYHLLSRIFRFKTVLVYHEYRSDFGYRQKNKLTKFNDNAFDKYFINFVDGVFPISEFLIEHINKKNKNKPFLKIPPLTDFNLFDVKISNNENYFLFCGSAGFQEIIEFIIIAFEKVQTSYLLYLVCSGSKAELSVLNAKIAASTKKQSIKLFSDISEDELIKLYINSKGLLIPLKNDLRDRARFPQKTSEYTASGAPIISTKFGEIEYYFTDNVNALIADDFDVNLFAKKIQYVVDEPQKAIEIGKAGKILGREIFNYASYTGKVKEFVNSLTSKK